MDTNNLENILRHANKNLNKQANMTTMSMAKIQRSTDITESINKAREQLVKPKMIDEKPRIVNKKDVYGIAR